MGDRWTYRRPSFRAWIKRTVKVFAPGPAPTPIEIPSVSIKKLSERTSVSIFDLSSNDSVSVRKLVQNNVISISSLLESTTVSIRNITYNSSVSASLREQ